MAEPAPIATSFVPPPPRLTEDEIDDLLYFARAGEFDDFKTTLSEISSSHNRYDIEVLAATVDSNSGNSVLHMAGANGHTSIVEYVLSLPCPPTDPTNAEASTNGTAAEAHHPTSTTLNQTPPPTTTSDPLASSASPIAATNSTEQPPTSTTTTTPAAASTETIDPPTYMKSLVNLQNSSRNTPLHWSCVNNRLEVTRLLILRGGADASILNAAGHDAVYEAEAAGHEGLVAWMLASAEGLDASVGVQANATADTDADADTAQQEDEDVEMVIRVGDTSGINGVDHEEGKKEEKDEVGKRLEGLDLESTAEAETIR